MSGEDTVYQLVLPVSEREEALHGLHDQVGHFGREQTLELLRERFFWPRMADNVAEKVKTCEACVKRKARAPPKAPLRVTPADGIGVNRLLVFGAVEGRHKERPCDDRSLYEIRSSDTDEESNGESDGTGSLRLFPALRIPRKITLQTGKKLREQGYTGVVQHCRYYEDEDDTVSSYEQWDVRAVQLDTAEHVGHPGDREEK